jgi:hypothetical protein
MSLNLTTVISHSHESEPRKWHEVKGEIIRKFRTVKRAAVLAKCHPNSFRLAAVGQCPRIIKWLKRHGVKLVERRMEEENVTI